MIDLFKLEEEVRDLIMDSGKQGKDKILNCPGGTRL